MALSPDMLALKARCAKALQMGAGLARVEAHLASLGAVPAPAGLSKEQHLMDVLSAMEDGSYRKPEPVKAPEPEPVKLEEAPEPVKAEEPAVEAAPEPAVEGKKGKKGR